MVTPLVVSFQWPPSRIISGRALGLMSFLTFAMKKKKKKTCYADPRPKNSEQAAGSPSINFPNQNLGLIWTIVVMSRPTPLSPKKVPSDEAYNTDYWRIDTHNHKNWFKPKKKIPSDGLC